MIDKDPSLQRKASPKHKRQKTSLSQKSFSPKQKTVRFRHSNQPSIRATKEKKTPFKAKPIKTQLKETTRSSAKSNLNITQVQKEAKKVQIVEQDELINTNDKDFARMCAVEEEFPDYYRKVVELSKETWVKEKLK